MKISTFLYFAKFGIRTVLFRKKDPILGTIIVTDRCNLSCRHCSVNNITGVIHPYRQIKGEMEQLYAMGVRILFFCGGETFLWRDDKKCLRDLVMEAKEMGFLIVNVVTNGTLTETGRGTIRSGVRPMILSWKTFAMPRRTISVFIWRSTG